MHRLPVLRCKFRLCFLLLLAFALLSCSEKGVEPSGSGSSPGIETTEILWDEWGVPHIFAPDTAQLFYANGWAQTRNHGDLLLRLIGQARGRAAEYWGEDYLDSDRWTWTTGIPPRAAGWYEVQGAEFRSALDSFTRGVNDYAARHRDRINDDVEVVLPVVPTDFLAHLQRILHFSFIVHPRDIAGASQRWKPGGERPGSNAWAIGPQRSASGNAMLVANPHLPWDDLFTWMELHLVTPEVNITGGALVGSLFVGIGFNDHLGWTHTVNTHDGADLFELELRGEGYLWDGETRAFESESVTLKVRQEGAAFGEEKLKIRRSIHGPVIQEKSGKALALRVVGLEDPHLFEQYWEMAKAVDLGQFTAAQKRLQMPMFTTMYADREGHIFHLFGGQTPVRSDGDWEHWSGIVPGTSSANLWHETHRYEELPQVLDPESGWLQNANDPPWTTTFPEALDADDFPPYMAPRFMHFRAQQSARLLLDDESLTFEDLVTYKHSNQMRLAERILDDVETAVMTNGSERAKRALEVLRAWDRAADATSRGGVLFAHLSRELERSGGGYAVAWSEERALDTPDGLADPAAAAAALDRAALTTEQKHGTLDAPWGEVYRLRRGDYDLPANGGPGNLGIFRVVDFRPAGDQFVAASGDSYVAVVEFSEPVRAATLLSYGNATQPGSPHVGDQLELFARKELRPVWRAREEIEAHLKEIETF